LKKAGCLGDWSKLFGTFDVLAGADRHFTESEFLLKVSAARSKTSRRFHPP